MSKYDSAYANILRALIDKAGGELIVEITNESDSPFTLAHKVEYEGDKTFVRLMVITDENKVLQ